MLISFTMNNFKSFKESTTLSAETGERLSKFKETNTLSKGDITVLKNIMIFGPNGSGKSNLIDGLKTMRSMITYPVSSISRKLPANNFKLDDSSQEKDTSFEAIFEINDTVYKYSYTFNQSEITSEELDILAKNDWKVYFSRKGQEFLKSVAGLENIESQTNKNSLYLFNAQLNNNPVAIEAFRWFSEDLIFVEDFSEEDNISEMAPILKNSQIKKQFLKFLRFADLSINDVEVIEETTPLARYLLNKHQIEDGSMTNYIYTEHKIYNSNGDVTGLRKFRLTDESRGTQKIFLIALAFINAELSRNCKTIFFDEFDDSLHLELSQAMIKIFNSKENKNQFIITTHELQLLDSDVRVDQIYLVQKDFRGSSELTSIFDFKDTKNTTRSGISYMKRYMQGRFGAAPVIDTNEMLGALTDVHFGNEADEYGQS